MDKVITDNSKVNINLLNENKLLKKQVQKLKLDKEELEQQLNLSGVSYRRELLNSFLDWEDTRTMGKTNSRELNNKYIDDFLKTI